MISVKIDERYTVMLLTAAAQTSKYRGISNPQAQKAFSDLKKAKSNLQGHVAPVTPTKNIKRLSVTHKVAVNSINILSAMTGQSGSFFFFFSHIRI